MTDTLHHFLRQNTGHEFTLKELSEHLSISLPKVRRLVKDLKTEGKIKITRAEGQFSPQKISFLSN